MGDTQFFQVVNTGLFAIRRMRSLFQHGNELTLVGNARIVVDRKIAMMHFVDNGIRLMGSHHILVIFPTVWICFGKVDNCRTFSVDAHCFCPYTRRFLQPFAVHFHLECVELAVKLFAERSTPDTGLRFFLHFYGLAWTAVLSVGIKMESDCLSSRRPQCKVSAAHIHFQFQIVAVICRIAIKHSFFYTWKIT